MEPIEESAGKRPLIASAVVAFGLGLLCQVELLESAFGAEALADGAGELASRGRAVMLAISFLLALLACGPLARSRPMSVTLSVALLALGGFEALAGPFVGRDTTLFLRDPELGWRLRPGGDDEWLGHRVRINERGFRGRLPSDQASQGVLFLGDSVIFGAFIGDDAETISAQTELRLAEAGAEAQCINAGVGGWAPWQERLWYEREGASLGAQVVMIHLVLNDVTEPLSLELKGGVEEGFQLDRTRAPGLLSGTVWATALRRWRRSLRGDEPRVAAAREEALGVYELLRSPSLPASRAAWAQHLMDVGELVDAVLSKGATPVIVAHPYTVQFEVPGLWWPQDGLRAWCASREVSFVDVGRLLAEARPDPVDAYHDAVHPNPEGAGLIGALLAEVLLREGLLE